MTCLVAIPARNEADRIGACLAALASDPCPAPLTVLLFANNCTDATVTVAQATARAHGLDLRVIEETLPPGSAHAGEARRRAMECADRIAGPDAVLMTTDADGRVEPGWRCANLQAIAAGADVVCGMAIIDPVEALSVPRHLHDDDEAEYFYAALLDEIASLIDPDPADPWPRHMEESGASIALRPAMFRLAGGVPRLALGEDRALVRRCAAFEARIRHLRDARVVVSGRLDGRAAGGMADTMRRRITAQDRLIDDRLESVANAIRRARLRRRFRIAFRAGCLDAGLARALGVAGADLEAAMARPYAGDAWNIVEQRSLLIAARHPPPRSGLASHIARAQRARASLRAISRVALPADPADRAAPCVTSPA